jgi:hypothetical protein
VVGHLPVSWPSNCRTQPGAPAIVVAHAVGTAELVGDGEGEGEGLGEGLGEGEGEGLGEGLDEGDGDGDGDGVGEEDGLGKDAGGAQTLMYVAEVYAAGTKLTGKEL